MRLITACICCMLITVLFMGCGNEWKAQAPASASSSVTVDTFDGYAGQGRIISQTFYEVPKRVLAVSESSIDNMLFLELQDHIAAVSSCTADERWPGTDKYRLFYKLADYGYPSKEAVLGLQPDLIVSWGSLFGDSALGSVTYWHTKGIHTYVLSNTMPAKYSNGRKVENIIRDLRTLTQIFRIQDERLQKIDALQQRIDKLKQKAAAEPAEKRPSVVTIQYVYGNEFYGRGNTDMTTDIIAVAGGRSLDADIGGKKSVEYLIKQNPDVIMVVDMPRRPAEAKIRTMRVHPLLQRVTAVKHNQFFKIPYRAFYGGSVYTIEETERLHEYLKQCIRG